MLRSGDGGETGESGARATIILPPSGGKRKTQSAATTTMTTPPSTTTCHATMRWLMLWSEWEICTPHLPCPCLLCLARLSPQVLPERLLVLVSCIHVPMPCPHADGLPHDVIRIRIVVESISSAMLSVCCLIGLRPLPSSFAFVVVVPPHPSLP